MNFPIRTTTVNQQQCSFGFIQAIEELVLNSVDAGSTCVAIRLNVHTNSVQVIDNGKGIARDYLGNINKGTENNGLQQGQSLSRIIGNCSSLEIVSRHGDAQETYKILFEAPSFSRSEIEVVEFRPSSGTTVIINGFLQLSFTNSSNRPSTVDQVEKLVKSLSLVHSQISFSLRDDSSQPPSLFVQTSKKSNTIATARKIFNTGKSEHFFTFRRTSQYFKIKGLIGKSTSGGYLQYFFVNNRAVEEPSISQLIQSVLKSKIDMSCLVIILNLKCSRTEYRFSLVNDQRVVEFNHLEELVSLIKKALTRVPCRFSTVPLPNSAWIPQPEMSQTANEILALASNLGDNIFSASPIRSQIWDRPANPFVNQESQLPLWNVDMACADRTSLKNQSSIEEPLPTSCRHTAKLRISPSYGKISWDSEKVNIDQRFCSDVTRSANHLSDQCVATVDQIIHQWETEEEDSSPPSLGYESFFLELGKSFEDVNAQGNQDPSIQDLVDEGPTGIKIKKTTSSGNGIQIKDFNGIPSSIARHPVHKPTHKILTQNKVLLKPKEYWSQSKRPLNVANSSRHSLPQYRTIPSRRYSYDKSMFGEVAIVNQVDRKFICCVAEQEGKNHLVLIDQHAAHERVCLEKLIQIHSSVDANGLMHIKSSPVHPSLELELNAEDMEKLQLLQSDLTRFGLQWRIHDLNQISITHVPACFLSRETTEVRRRRSSIYKELVEMLIRDTMTEFSQNGTVSACLMPTSIRNVLNSLACHGAIRFGDELSMNQSTQLVRALGQCDVPFQCAHGRPLMTPLLAMEDLLPLTSTPIKRPMYSHLNAVSLS